LLIFQSVINCCILVGQSLPTVIRMKLNTTQYQRW